VSTVTLLEKLYAGLSLKTAESQIQASCEGLKVTIEVTEIAKRGWIRLNVSGEDEVAALNLLAKEFGAAPIYAKNVKEGDVFGGKIVFSGRSSMEIYVDIGVFLPAPVDATVSLQHLQAQLADGKKLPLQRITQLFCFLDNFPIRTQIKHVDGKRKHFVAELSEEQILLISQWTDSNLERLIVLGALYGILENAVKTTEHSRDIVEIESLGMLEHAVVCKLGTNAVGLIPKLGRLIPKAVFGVFSPKETSRFAKA
jgi:hypothetical protein